MAKRRKYRFPGADGRAQAELALSESEERERRMFWFAAALVDERIAWTESHGDYRMAMFVAVPGSAMGTVLMVSEFYPPCNRMPSFHVMDEREFSDTYTRALRVRDDGWVDSARAAERAARERGISWYRVAEPAETANT